MAKHKHKYLKLIAILALLVVVTSVLVVAFTFGADFEAPDAIVRYYQNQLKWNIATDENGVANLRLFGEPEEGEDLAIIHPYSGDTYNLRIENRVFGEVKYTAYLYCENEYDIPLKFDITRTESMAEAETVPSELDDYQIIEKLSGSIKGKSLENLEINWFWDSESDEKDTEFGDKAVSQDMTYTIHVMLIIEDNNTYRALAGDSSAKLLHRAYVKGYPDKTFGPDRNILRSETAAIFARIRADYDESKLTDLNSKFIDVPSDRWYTHLITSLEDEGIIKGYDDGTFRPDNSILRCEFAAVVVRFFEDRAGKITPVDIDFKDVDENHWSYEYIRKAVAQGFVVGYPDGTFKPDAYITRAEVVTIVNRLLQRKADEDYVDKNQNKLIQFTDLVNKKYYWAYYDIYEAANNHYATTTAKKEERWSHSWH